MQATLTAGSINDPRPTRLTDEMRLEAARLTAADVTRDCPAFHGEDVEGIAKQIAAEARYEFMDGYDLARALDDHCYWSPDAEVVAALDNWQSHARAVLEKAQKEWRSRVNPQPTLAVGARVKTHRGEVGVITDRDYKHGIAQYLVQEDGTPDTRKLIVNYEDATEEAA